MNDTPRIKQIRQIWTKAKRHKKASRLGLPADMLHYQLCQCCDEAVYKEHISVWEHTKQFQVFGFGYPLWYSFLKYSIFLVLVLIATKTAGQIYMASEQNKQICFQNKKVEFSTEKTIKSTYFEQGYDSQIVKKSLHLRNYQQNKKYSETVNQQNKKQNSQINNKKSSQNQKKNICTSFMVYLSILKGQKVLNSEFLRIVQFFIHLITLISIRSILLKELQYYHERNTMISNYSLIISNIPSIYGSRDMVLKMLENQFGKYIDFSIKEMLFIFKSETINQIKQKIAQISEEIIDKINLQRFTEIELHQEELNYLNQKLDDEVKLIQGDIQRDYIKCNKMIIVMNVQADKAQVLQQFQSEKTKGRKYTQYFNTTNMLDKKEIDIQITDAPQPNEIIWENLGISKEKSKALIIQGWALTFLFLGLSTVLFYFLLQSKTKLFLAAVQIQQNSTDNSTFVKYKIYASTIAIVSIIGVVLFNKFFLCRVLLYFVKMQRHSYTDSMNYSFAIKYALGMFFTTAVMTLAVEAITFNNLYSHSFGLIEEETIMFFVTAFVIPLIWLINPLYRIKKCELQKYFNKLISQQKANQLVENYPYDLGKRYAQIFQIMWFTFLYSQLIPLGSFLIFFGLIFYYWVDKYNFVRKSSLKGGISGKMAILGLKSLDATLFLTYAGQILFDLVLRHKFDYLSVFLMVFGIIYLFLPISQLIWYFNHQKFRLEQKSYDEAKDTFKQNYHTLHPVYSLTHKQLINEHKKKVKQYHKDQLKKIKLYGVGRGYYMKNIPSQKMTLLHSQNRISSKYII